MRLRPGVGFMLLAALPTRAVLAQPFQLNLDRSQSFLAVRVDKAGVFSAFAGHRHGILATTWSAQTCWDLANPPGSSVSIVVKTASLRIDTPEAREKAGVEPGGPSASDVEQIQGKMLGPKNLAAESYPEITFKTESVRRKDQTTIVLTGPLTIRGQTRKASADVTIHQSGSSSDFTGRFTIKLTDFGIQPESVAGVVNVKDEIQIRFHFSGTPGGACQ